MRDGDGDEGGFSLIEVVVAMAVFTVLVTVALGLILRTASVTTTNNRRVVAANLANKQIESARSQLATQIPDGGRTRTESVGGVAYTVTQTANYLAPDATTSVCTGSGNQLAYKLITVTVTWPSMGTVPPVRADTLRTIGVGEGLDATTGTVALAVTDALGAPVSGIPVVLSSGDSVTTGIDGCAVLTGLAPSTYIATVNTPGWVGAANATATSLGNLVVSAGSITRGTLLYDRARSLDLAPADAPGFAPVPGLPLTLRNTYTGAITYPSCAAVTGQGCLTGFPGQGRSLFPAQYTIWAGTCADAGTAPVVVDLTSGAADGTSRTVGLGRVTVDVRRNGVSTAGYVVYAVHAKDPVGANPGCTGGEVYTLPPSAVGGTGVLLPYGTWTFALSATPPNGSPTVTLSESTSPSVVVVAP